MTNAMTNAKRLLLGIGGLILAPLLALLIMGGGGYVLNRMWSAGSVEIDEMRRAADIARIRGVEKRLGELEVQVDSIALTFRLDRQAREDDRQRRIEAMLARVNAERDGGRR